MIYLSDGPGRHLVCWPYSVPALHEMADDLGIKRCWFHRGGGGRFPHYDVPKRRIAEIAGQSRRVTTRQIWGVINGTWDPDDPRPLVSDDVTITSTGGGDRRTRRFTVRAGQSLTPLMDELQERGRLFPDGRDEAPLPAASPLDDYFMGVAAKHGIDFTDPGDEP